MRREVKIGIFAVLMIGALWAGIRFLKGFDIFSRNAVYYAAYDQVDGVQNASPILIRGVKVGAVTDISFDPSIGNEVVLQLTIQRKYRIPSNSEARIYSNSIMGAKAIEIALGDAGTYLQSGDTLCSSRSKGLMDNLNLIMEQNAANIEGTMSHLNSITGSVNGMLLSQRANLESAVANLTRFSEMLGENSPRMDSIILNLSNFTDQIQRENLAGALDSTLMNLNAILARVNAGEGTVGQLVSDPRLYESLNEATANLASLLANLQAHPARYVHFSLFGRDPEKADRKQQKKEAKHARRDSLKALKAAR